MKFTASVTLTILLSFTAGLFVDIFPWYGFVFCALLVSFFIPQKPFSSFLAGFLALFLLWGMMALIKDIQNQQLLSAKVAAILPLDGSSLKLILITAFTGGLLAGFAALTGCFLRRRK
jgi:hypothetical protein